MRKPAGRSRATEGDNVAGRPWVIVGNWERRAWGDADGRAAIVDPVFPPRTAFRRSAQKPGSAAREEGVWVNNMDPARKRERDFLGREAFICFNYANEGLRRP